MHAFFLLVSTSTIPVHTFGTFLARIQTNSARFFVRNCSKFTKTLLFGQFGPTLPHPLFTPAIWEPKTWRRPKNQIKLPECIRFCAESNSNAAEICLQVIWFGLRTKRAQSQVFLAKNAKNWDFHSKFMGAQNVAAAQKSNKTS